MDDYELQQELEALAGNARGFDTEDGQQAEPVANTMARWQKLFNLAADDVVDRIMEHRDNLIRTRITDDHWDLVRGEKEAAGYDREAYEYEINVAMKKASMPDLIPTAAGGNDSSIKYLVELSGPLDSPEKVQLAAELESRPVIVSGQSIETRTPVQLCCIDSSAKTSLCRWAAERGGGWEPTILVDPRSLR